MKRLATALACVLLFTSCKKETPPPEPEVTEQQAKEPAPEAEPAAQEEEAAASPEEEEKVEVSQAMLDRYVTYWDRELTIVHEGMTELGKVAKEIDEKKDPGMADAMKVATRTNEITDKINARKEQAMKDSGLTERQIEYVQGLISSVGVARYLLAKAAGDQEKSIAEMKKNAETHAPEARAETMKLIADMEARMAEMKNASEARKEYGDAAVELVIANEKKILPLYEKSMTAAFGKP